MQNHPIQQYVTDARKAGMSKEQIVQELTSAGWQVHDFIDLILDTRPETDVPVSGSSIISIRNLSKHYGPTVKALDNVSLEVQAGKVTAFLGPNGAGKTTLVRILTTLLAPTSGQATVAGFDVMRDAQDLRSVIGLAGQYAAVDDTLTGRENLEMVGRLYHMSARDAKARAAELLRQFNLEDAGDRVLKTYSGGMRRRLDLAASLVMRPKILFLDEPTTGLDPRSRFALWNIIRDLVAEGTTVLLTTQYLEEADQLAHKIFVIDHGAIIAQGTADELKRQVGGDVVELHVANHDQASHASELIARFGNGKAQADTTTGIVTMPVSGGASVLVDIVRELDKAGTHLSDVVLRRPTLDDVFMKLTGRGTE